MVILWRRCGELFAKLYRGSRLIRYSFTLCDEWPYLSIQATAPVGCVWKGSVS